MTNILKPNDYLIIIAIRNNRTHITVCKQIIINKQK